MTKELHILLADDDKDDRFFFNKALKEFHHHRLTTVENGEKLMNFLTSNYKQLPDIVFLDLNMPRKTGNECLADIKNNHHLKHIPVIIYSTSLQEEVANLLYKTGAHYYLQKCDFAELKRKLSTVFCLLEKSHERPPKEKFIINNIHA
jgi:CheY-like chemotaxis protein